MDLDIEMADSMEMDYDAFDAEPIPADDILVITSLYITQHSYWVRLTCGFLQQPNEPEEPGEIADDEPQGLPVAAQTIVPTKIHIRGLDSLHTEDVKAYVTSHFRAVNGVEWIDDTSANLVFDTASTAREALAALSSIELADTTALAAGESLPAKPMEGRPHISLQVRFAVDSDKKEAGASQRSRYYLLHPEHDPEERRRRRQDARSKYRDRDGYGRRDDDRRRRGSGQYESETFEASMYDDAPQPQRSRRYSDPEDGPTAYARNNRHKELFKDRRPRRDRSASPRRTDDRVASSRNNRDRAHTVKGRLKAENQAKELFPGKVLGRGGQLDELERSIGSASLREEDMPKVVPTTPSTGVFNIRGMASRDSGGFSIKGSAKATTPKELFPEKRGARATAARRS
ncbi:hypothetical protein CDD80_3870 [Ophiocordyceps camponoti-rufipedis]|uniref:Uncharacterized protein n=1 Tax=Ophiocordyceps camponoti-rufipedis TaxID=2004952 RepID=A0A2C5ZIW1_9HYPO|nr:hypothetical protein CDD80_3870 [Ophiocordyceps camponoti-rufipedis]